MLADADIMAFAATTDAPRARTFYETVLGLTFVSDDDYALVFDAHGTMLRIQKVAAFTPLPFTLLGWRVADIQKAARAIVAKGAAFERYGHFQQDALGIWDSPSGAKVAWLKDPDGNTLSITQLPP